MINKIFMTYKMLFPPSSKVIPLNLKDFAGRTVKNPKFNNLGLIAFTASWCGFCQRLAKELEKAAELTSNQFPIGYVDNDQFPGLTKQFQVTAFPTIFVVQNGQIKGQFHGKTSQEILNFACRNLRSPSFC